MTITTEPTVPVHYSYSPNFSLMPAGTLRDVRSIVLHSIEGSLEGGLATFSQPGGVSAHYAIGPSGTIWLVVPENAVAFHVAAFGADPSLNRNRPAWLPPLSGPMRYSRANAVSIGIEFAGWAAQGFTAAQYAAAGRLVADICQRWGLVPTYLPSHGAEANITTHGWLQTDRTDPGPRFSWPAFIAAVEAAQRREPAAATSRGEETPNMPLSEEDAAVLEVVHGLGANAASITGWIVALGALEESNAALASQVAALLGEAQTAARRATGITVTYDDGSTAQVEVPV